METRGQAKVKVERERFALLRQLDQALEKPMLILGLIWLGLLLLEMVRGAQPILEAAGTVIWALFVLEFGLKLLIAPAKGAYLRQNWLVALSLLVPGLRVLRIARVLRAARAARALQMARGLAGFNSGLRALRRIMQRRGLGYVLAITSVVALAGAAGMQMFERGDTRPGAFDTFGSSLWFTLMLLTSVGSEYWPRTAGGRTLCLILSIYGFAVFGYITAALASFFVDRDKDKKEAKSADPSGALRAEIAALREELRRGGRPLTPPPGGAA